MPKALASWRLFWVLALAETVAICAGLPAADLHSRRGTDVIIIHSVRCALPLFLVAFTASSLARLWPSRGTRWVLSNRRYFGVAFAFGMGWHLSFVAYSMLLLGRRLDRISLMEDLIGLTFLIAMTLTSFRWASRHISVATWRRLHKTGIYVIWLLALYLYQGHARAGHDIFDIAAVGFLLLAGGLRAAAWTVAQRAAASGAADRESAAPRASG